MTDPIKISRDLAEIVLLAADLLGQAVNDAAAQVDGSSLPGGRAMIALAPVADIAQWEQQVEETEATWARAVAEGYADESDRPDVASDEDDTTEPALQLLRFWSDHYRRVTQQDWLHVKTLGTEANYLRTNLTWILGHEPHADVFARDVNRARVSLENILTAGKRPERSRVECDRCEAQPQLIRVRKPRQVTGYACSLCSTPVGLAELDHCPNPWCHTVAPAAASEWDSGDTHDDWWKCPACKARFDVDAFKRAHAKHLLRDGAARYVAQGDAVDTLVAQGRSKRTVRSWLDCPIRHVEDRCTVCKRKWEPQEHPACPGRTKSGATCGGELKQVWRGDRDDIVEGYCDLKTRRVYVWWPDLWRRHLTRKIRQRQVAS